MAFEEDISFAAIGLVPAIYVIDNSIIKHVLVQVIPRV